MAVTMRIVAALLVIAAVWGGKYVVSLIFRAAGPDPTMRYQPPELTQP